jgi:hypothetical protein
MILHPKNARGKNMLHVNEKLQVSAFDTRLTCFGVYLKNSEN